MLSPAIYLGWNTISGFHEVLEKYMFYIIKQVLNEPPGWKEDTHFGQGGNKGDHVYMAIFLFVH